MSKNGFLTLTFYDRRRERIIKEIKNLIKENKGIDLFKLLAILHVKPPYIDKSKGTEYLKDMEKAGLITVNEETREVKICQ